MDPHSRHSQFNQRPPKTGPIALASRHMDFSLSKSSPSLDEFTRHPAPSRKSSSASSPSLLASRPIATNSRIKQDEKLRKDMYLAFVNNALQQKVMVGATQYLIINQQPISLNWTQGICEPFDELVEQFNINKPDNGTPSPVPQLRLWIQALMHVVSRLERSHSALVEAVVRIPWMTMETTFVKSYTSFIGILVSARPEYLSLVLGEIAQGFTYRAFFFSRRHQSEPTVLFRIRSTSATCWPARELLVPPHAPGRL